MQRVFSDPVHSKRFTPAGVEEAERQVGVRAAVDVLVCGGGPAGVGAALASAREGARTMLIERHGMLGGVWTAGLLNPFFESDGRGYVVQDLVRRLKEAGSWRRWGWAYTFDPEIMRRTLETMMREAGVEFLYYTLVVDSVVEGSRLKGIIVESKRGREALLAKTVVDSTGDGDVAARCGCAYEFGREVDGLAQPMTLMFRIRGAGGFEQRNPEELYDRMAQAITENGLQVKLPFDRCPYAPWIISLPASGMAAVQATHVYRCTGLDPEDLTRGTVEARQQAANIVEVLRHVPGLQGVELVDTASAIGVREGRRICGLYRLSYEDLVAGQTFEDAVTACSFGVDIHEPAPGSGIPSGFGKKMKPYEIPFRCLVPKGLEGLLLAGRCISGSHEAHASYRVTGTAMATGQAAGLAAAWAGKGGGVPREVNGCDLREALKQRGVKFLTPK